MRSWSRGWRCCALRSRCWRRCWRARQASRLPAAWAARPSSSRRGRVRSFADHQGCPPWLWTAQLFEEWCADLRSVHHVAASTLRGPAGRSPVVLRVRLRSGLRLGGGELRYSARTRSRSPPGGTLPAMSRTTNPACAPRVHHRGAAGVLRPCSTTRSRRSTGRGARAGCRRSGTRSCSRPRTATGCGARDLDARRHRSADPQAPEFGEYGVCQVRYGKANKGSHQSGAAC